MFESIQSLVPTCLEKLLKRTGECLQAYMPRTEVPPLPQRSAPAPFFLFSELEYQHSADCSFSGQRLIAFQTSHLPLLNALLGDSQLRLSRNLRQVRFPTKLGRLSLCLWHKGVRTA